MPIHATSDLADSSPWRLLCDDFENYPRNLAPRLGNPIVLQQQGAKLRDDERRLFNTTRSNIYMTELLSGSHVNCVAQTQGENIRPSQCLVLQERPQDQVPPGTQPYHGSCAQNLEFTGIRDLKKHLQYPFENAKKDTAMRHIFIQAGSNRSALLCSASIFKYLCSYHEVSPNFLKLVHSLGNQTNSPQSSHFGGYFEELHAQEMGGLATGQAISTLSAPIHAGPLSMPTSNRSHKQLRSFYQLNGMEPGQADENGVREWSMRQVTVYHSFDLENTRQLWITIKANSQIRQRFKEQRSSEAIGHPSQSQALQDLDKAFSSSLSAHLLHLEWCIEGWRWYIDDREVRIRDVVEKVQEAPISYNQTTNIFRQRSMYEQQQPAVVSSPFPRLDSWVTKASRHNTMEKSGSAKENNSRVGSWMQGFSRRNTVEDEKASEIPRDQPIAKEAAIALTEAKDQERRFTDTEGIFKDFSMSGYQDLTAFCTGLQDTKLAIDSNLRVLQGLLGTYTSFIDSEECPEKIVTSCGSRMRHFKRRINSMEMELKNEHQRVDSLVSQLQDAKPLYESVLQYRNIKASEAIASHARYASLRMEAVGERTERLTSSMHVITTFTLLLLPGTFLGSLFSTDIISRGDSGVKLDSVLGSLFLEICLPMMIISLIAWGFYMCLKRRRSNDRRGYWTRLEEGRLSSDEKSKAAEETVS